MEEKRGSFAKKFININKKMTLISLVFIVIISGMIAYQKLVISKNYHNTVTGYVTEVDSLKQALELCNQKIGDQNKSLTICNANMEKKNVLQKNLTSLNIALSAKNKEIIQDTGTLKKTIKSWNQTIISLKSDLNKTDLKYEDRREKLANCTDDLSDKDDELDTCIDDLDSCLN